SRVRIGALVTPLSRRRVHKVARETATLDVLSSGRLIFGAGLGSARNNELGPFGDVTDPRERVRLLHHSFAAPARCLAWAGVRGPSRSGGPGRGVGWPGIAVTGGRSAGR